MVQTKKKHKTDSIPTTSITSPTPGSPLPPKKKRRAPKAKVTPANSDITFLQNLSTKNKKQHGLSENTQGQYEGSLKAGRMWLAAVIVQRRKRPEDFPDDGIDTDKFALAFNDKPNHYSAQALEFLLVHNCFERGLKEGTGWKYYSAFKDLWKRNGYNGKQYSIDEPTKAVSGNPADAADVQALMESIKHRDRKNGSAATRDHAEAVSIEELEAIIVWSRSVIPDEYVEKAIKGQLDAEWTKLAMEHAEMRAFFITGFTLWTRNFELCSLKRSDIEWDHRKSRAPFTRYFTIFLENRKGWQNKSDYDCSRESNTYNFYETSHDAPVLDVYKVLPLWVRLLESKLGRALNDDELIFPTVTVSGQPQTTVPMSQNGIQSHIDKFTQGAGLKRRLTTHSMRRGGAQYRFVYAPWGKRWSLRKVRWWGGWAEGENVETLMKYLLDSLSSYEENYSDALDPDRLDRADHFMGEQHDVSPVTHAELGEYARNMGAIFGAALHQASFPHHPSIPATNHGHAQWHPQLFVGGHSSPPGASPNPAVHHPVQPHSTLSPSYLPPPLLSTPQVSSFRHISDDVLRAQSSQPNGSAIIPPLSRVKGKAWTEAIKQWHDIDSNTGMALKDWPDHWYKGCANNRNGVKRGHRKSIALEYAKAGSDRTEFLRRYPEASGTLNDLLNAIRGRRGLYRTSKNGTPSERTAAQAAEDFSDGEESD